MFLSKQEQWGGTLYSPGSSGGLTGLEYLSEQTEVACRVCGRGFLWSQKFSLRVPLPFGACAQAWTVSMAQMAPQVL